MPLELHRRNVPELLGMWLLVALLSGCGKPKTAATPSPASARTVHVTSAPSAATVWIGDEIVGLTPCELALPASTQLRIASKGHQSQTVEANTGAVHVELLRDAQFELRCVTYPRGAEVYVDGERRGVSPLTIPGLQAGEYELLIRAEGRTSIREWVTVDGDLERSFVLENPSLDLLRARIAEAPNVMANHVDLAHELVLERKLSAACDVLSVALEQVLTGEVDEEKRFWSEVNKVVDAQYHYGGKEEIKTARGHIKTMLETALDKHPAGTPNLWASYITTLRVTGEQEKARTLYEDIRGRYPKSRAIKRLRGHFR